MKWPISVLYDVEILGQTCRGMPHLIAKLAPVLLYDVQCVLDVTPGRGGFWSELEPLPWTVTASVHDFRALPFNTASFDAVFYDPPHAAALGNGAYFKAYGTYSAAELPEVIAEGARESWRVAGTALITKTTDHVNSARFQRQSGWVIEAVGQEPYQVITVVHNPVGSRRWSGFAPGEAPPQSARSVSSTLLIFRRGSQEHSAPARERRLREGMRAH